MLQNKQTTVYTTVSKILNQNTKLNPGMKFALFNCKGEKRMDNFAFLNSLHYFTFTFSTNLQKNFVVYVCLRLNLPPPPIRASMLLAGPPLPLQAYVHFMHTHPMGHLFEIMCVRQCLDIML